MRARTRTYSVISWIVSVRIPNTRSWTACLLCIYFRVYGQNQLSSWTLSSWDRVVSVNGTAWHYVSYYCYEFCYCVSTVAVTFGAHWQWVRLETAKPLHESNTRQEILLADDEGDCISNTSRHNNKISRILSSREKERKSCRCQIIIAEQQPKLGLRNLARHCMSVKPQTALKHEFMGKCGLTRCTWFMDSWIE